MCRDALDRDESCGGHFREEYQTPDGEALRDDEHFASVAAWEYQGERIRAAAAASRSRWFSRPCSWRRAATNDPMNFKLKSLAAEECRRRKAS